MSRPFDSFDFLNRAWDVRLLETQSLRSVFVALLMDVFFLGIVTFMLIYQLFRLQRFDWTNALLFVVFLLPVYRYVRLIYQRLGPPAKG